MKCFFALFQSITLATEPAIYFLNSSIAFKVIFGYYRSRGIAWILIFTLENWYVRLTVEVRVVDDSNSDFWNIVARQFLWTCGRSWKDYNLYFPFLIINKKKLCSSLFGNRFITDIHMRESVSLKDSDFNKAFPFLCLYVILSKICIHKLIYEYVYMYNRVKYEIWQNAIRRR